MELVSSATKTVSPRNSRVSNVTKSKLRSA
jgi:hypothetical protein